MPIERNTVDPSKFNTAAGFPYELRQQDFQMAMQDVYDFSLTLTRTSPEKGSSAWTTCFALRSCLVFCPTC